MRLAIRMMRKTQKSIDTIAELRRQQATLEGEDLEYQRDFIRAESSKAANHAWHAGIALGLWPDRDLAPQELEWLREEAAILDPQRTAQSNNRNIKCFGKHGVSRTIKKLDIELPPMPLRDVRESVYGDRSAVTIGAVAPEALCILTKDQFSNAASIGWMAKLLKIDLEPTGPDMDLSPSAIRRAFRRAGVQFSPRPDGSFAGFALTSETVLRTDKEWIITDVEMAEEMLKDWNGRLSSETRRQLRESERHNVTQSGQEPPESGRRTADASVSSGAPEELKGPSRRRRKRRSGKGPKGKQAGTTANGAPALPPATGQVPVPAENGSVGKALPGQAAASPEDGKHAEAGRRRKKRRRGRSKTSAENETGGSTNAARPEERGFRVVDAYSRIVRLGEGVGSNKTLSEAAMDRAVDALAQCHRKLADRGVTRSRLIATEACRAAENGEEFIGRVKSETGLALEVVNRETEARLAVAGCASLVDLDADGVILFDIGGGSSEIVWLDLRNRCGARGYALTRFIRSWISLPVGVVNLAERHGGVHVTPDIFEAMVEDAADHLAAFSLSQNLSEAISSGRVHMLGTSGTVTTLAGVHLGLKRYDRRRVDGTWLADQDVARMIDQLRDMPYEARVENPCIGADRADLVLAGCAILEAIRRRWTCSRLRVADRGLREGILTELMAADGVWSHRRSGPRHHRSRVRSEP
eukprot:g1577.t1